MRPQPTDPECSCQVLTSYLKQDPAATGGVYISYESGEPIIRGRTLVGAAQCMRRRSKCVP